MEILDKILKKIKEKNTTEYKVLQETGLSKTFFQNWKHGSQPSIDKVKKIILYLNLSADELLETNYINNKPSLTENEKEMLELFQKLSDREQIKEISRLEDRVKQLNEMEGLSNSENDKAG